MDDLPIQHIFIELLLRQPSIECWGHDTIKAKAVPSRAHVLEISKYVHGMFYIMSDSDAALEKNTASEEERGEFGKASWIK